MENAAAFGLGLGAVFDVMGGQGLGDQAVSVVLDGGFGRDDGAAFEVGVAVDLDAKAAISRPEAGLGVYALVIIG